MCYSKALRKELPVRSMREIEKGEAEQITADLNVSREKHMHVDTCTRASTHTQTHTHTHTHTHTQTSRDETNYNTHVTPVFKSATIDYKCDF